MEVITVCSIFLVVTAYGD